MESWLAREDDLHKVEDTVDAECAKQRAFEDSEEERTNRV